jgi:enoyl-CoA hydratase/carnithine racemase
MTMTGSGIREEKGAGPVEVTPCVLELKAFAGFFDSKDQREGMRAFVEKRKAAFVGQ